MPPAFYRAPVVTDEGCDMLDISAAQYLDAAEFAELVGRLGGRDHVVAVQTAVVPRSGDVAPGHDDLEPLLMQVIASVYRQSSTQSSTPTAGLPDAPASEIGGVVSLVCALDIIPEQAQDGGEGGHVGEADDLRKICEWLAEREVNAAVYAERVFDVREYEPVVQIPTPADPTAIDPFTQVSAIELRRVTGTGDDARTAYSVRVSRADALYVAGASFAARVEAGPGFVQQVYARASHITEFAMRPTVRRPGRAVLTADPNAVPMPAQVAPPDPRPVPGGSA